MRKHPVIVVPDVGELDHAWDLVGSWQLTARRDETAPSLPGSMIWRSWESGVLELPAGGEGQPSLRETLTRVSAVQRAAAGGGALTFLIEGPSLGALIVTLWPGELQLIGPTGPAGRLTLNGRRAAEYYQQKYPLEPV